MATLSHLRDDTVAAFGTKPTVAVAALSDDVAKTLVAMNPFDDLAKCPGIVADVRSTIEKPQGMLTAASEAPSERDEHDDVHRPA